jgi:hypothetical protein
MVGGCFEPSYPEGLLCSTALTCPPGQTCNMATLRCNVGGGSSELDGGIDETPDAISQAQLVMHLGDPCTVTASDPCQEFGLVCATRFDENIGFCSYACTFPARSCTNGYSKPGPAPRCELTNLRSVEICVIRCGADFGLPDTCPPGLVCRDMGSPSNGMNDTCTSPRPPSSQHLATLCMAPISGEPGTPCATLDDDLICLKYEPDDPTSVDPGFCTRPCIASGTVDGCNVGYAKPGLPSCEVLPGIATPHCVVHCGQDHSLPDTCPLDLVCRDTNDNSRNDTCLPNTGGT